MDRVVSLVFSIILIAIGNISGILLFNCRPLTLSELLLFSFIVSWSVDKRSAINIENVIAASATHDYKLDETDQK